LNGLPIIRIQSVELASDGFYDLIRQRPNGSRSIAPFCSLDAWNIAALLA
jgi:hypothetical protein